MNDLGFRDRNGFVDDLRDNRPVDRDTQNPRKLRREVRRRWGARLFAAGAFLMLAGGVALGAWRHYSQQQVVIATAEDERDFVPSVRVATVKASPDARHLAGDDRRIRAGRDLCPCDWLDQ